VVPARTREACAEQRIAGDVEGLVADLGDGACDDVVDLDRIDSGARNDLAQAVREEIGGQESCSAPLALPLPIGVRTALTMTASRSEYPAICSSWTRR